MYITITFIVMFFIYVDGNADGKIYIHFSIATGHLNCFLSVTVAVLLKNALPWGICTVKCSFFLQSGLNHDVQLVIDQALLELIIVPNHLPINKKMPQSIDFYNITRVLQTPS